MPERQEKEQREKFILVSVALVVVLGLVAALSVGRVIS